MASGGRDRFLQMSVPPRATFFATARYLPSALTPPTWKAPDVVVVREATFRQVPLSQCWILTGILAAQTLTSSFTVTRPFTLSPGRGSETCLPCDTAITVKSVLLTAVPSGVVTVIDRSRRTGERTP